MFFRASAASQGRSSRGCSELSSATSDSMVGQSGVGTIRGVGVPEASASGGAGVVTASTLAA